MNVSISSPDAVAPIGTRDADRDRDADVGAAELGRCDRQRRRRPLQRPPRHDRRLHALDREPDRSADRDESTPTRSLPARTTTRSRPRTRPATSARRRTRRARPSATRAPPSAPGSAGRDRCDRSGHAELGCRDRQRRRRPLQRPPRDHRRLHAVDGEPDRAADRHRLHRHGRRRHLLLQGHRRGRRRQRRPAVERGERDGDDGHDGAERAVGR